MPTVGVNLLWLVPGTVGGSEESTIRSLLAVATELTGRVNLRAYVRPELVAAHPALAESIELVQVPGLLESKAARVIAENTWLSIVSRHDDVVHHAGGAVTLTGTRPMIATIHDLQPLDMPENFSPAKRRWLGWLLPLTVRRAKRIVVPSQFTADRCTELLGATAEQLVVVPHGYEAGPLGTVPSGLDGASYLLFPGIAYPHKRHVDAITAFAELRATFPDLRLVFTGRPADESPSLKRQVASLGLGDSVHFLGRVPAEQLAALYSNAKALVFPSIYEGFGYPVLEAMAHGCPVVGVAASAVPEVAGDAGLIVAPNDPQQLAAALRSLLQDPELAARHVAAGVRRAADFTYQANGEALARVYCDALGLPSTT